MTNANATTTKPCRRCGGTGNVKSPVVHMGIPGLCYKCDGAGVLVLVSAATLRAAQATGVVDWRREIEGLAADETGAHALRVGRRRSREELDAHRAAHGASPLTDAGWEKSLACDTWQDDQHAARLDELRDRWRGAGDVPPITRSKWLSRYDADRLEKSATQGES